MNAMKNLILIVALVLIVDTAWATQPKPSLGKHQKTIDDVELKKRRKIVWEKAEAWRQIVRRCVLSYNTMVYATNVHRGYDQCCKVTDPKLLHWYGTLDKPKSKY